ncbi:unnamed protein product [Mytilus coruscus]|uniref:G-protein coupled receptors family 2 profile 2 domain-containing protein n=1 Tax=Mytilus coruscus TaxID=42192 RepID=A0A6J8ADG9_MYTCO|nr:unnamed protein product [Mytilus coruscus]
MHLFKDKCREVICPERHYYNKQNNKCERIYRNVRDVFYQVYYKITVQQEKVDQITVEQEKVDQIIVEQEKVECSIGCMIDDYLRVEDGICSYFERVLSGSQCCYLSNWYHPKDIKNSTHHEYIIVVNFLVTNLHNQTMYVESMSSSFVEIFENKSQLEPISRKALDIVPDLTEFDYFNNGLYDASYYDYPFYTRDDHCYADYKTINVVANYFCPRIKLLTKEVQLNTSYLTIMNKNIVFEINSVIQMEDGFLICLDDRMIAKRGSGESKSQTQRNDIENILSLICSITSITSLALTMTVYLLLKELRTLPGLQQLILSFHLLVAHALYLFGMNATYNTALCVAIGLLTHYLWLGSVLWMHICTLNIFRIFYYHVNTHSISNRMKLFQRYLLYSISVCCLFLTINIVYFFVSDNSTLGYLGYGVDRC